MGGGPPVSPRPVGKLRSELLRRAAGWISAEIALAADARSFDREYERQVRGVRALPGIGEDERLELTTW